MKRSKMFRLVTVCTFVVASTIFANLLMAQGGDPPTDVRYRIHWITGPTDTTIWQLNDLVVTTNDGIPTTALVVGSYYRENQPISGFVYDVLGTIDPDLTYASPDPSDPNFWDIENLVGPGPPEGAPDDWSTVKSSLRGANSAGLIAGYVEDVHGIEQAVYLNLDLGNPSASPYKLVMLPEPDWDFGECRGRDVTELGDILVQYLDPSDGDWRGYVYNAYSNSGPEDIASGDGRIVFSGEGSMFLNSLRQVVGKRADGMVIRYFLPTGNYEEFPNLYWSQEVNDLGQFAATATNIRGRHRYATRVGADSGSIEWEWTAAEKGTWGDRINIQGDLLFQYLGSSERFYYHEGLKESFNLKDLVIAKSDSKSWFRDQDHLGWMRISDRDFTGFGWVAKALRVTDSDGLQTWKLALLIPEVPQPTVSASWSQIEDPPLDIPDNNSGFAVSQIDVPAEDDFQIDNMTVNLDITHQRPGDLKVDLIGPGDVSVPLDIFSGDNPIPTAFDGVWTAGTTWRLEIRDTRKKKVGTLNDWKITVDYLDN